MTSPAASNRTADHVIRFLHCRTPSTWVDRAVADPDTLLADHASLELKAAQQAQKLIRQYGARRPAGDSMLSGAFRSTLMRTMSRLAREELRHFEQVVALIERRGGRYQALSPSRYAAELHGLARRREPDALVDALIIGAVIEARSCERFLALISPPCRLDQAIASFYASLLRSESRHFADYLDLARRAAGADISGRVDEFLDRDAALILAVDAELRFHSGVPAAGIATGGTAEAAQAAAARR